MTDLYKAPSFQFYPSDFLADTYDLSAEDVGIYIRLLCRQWDTGFLPCDVASLAKISGVSSKKMQQKMKNITRFFSRVENNHKVCVYQQARLERVRNEAAAFSAGASARGKMGANARWSGKLANADAMPTQCLSNAEVMPRHVFGNAKPMPNDSSPVSSLQSPLVSSLRSDTGVAESAAPDSPAPKKNNRIKPDTSGIPMPDFGPIEPDVKLFIAQLAAENKTGKIAETREIATRRELDAIRTQLGSDCFYSGLREANRRGKPHTNYVKRCAEGSSKNQAPAPSENFGDPGSRYDTPDEMRAKYHRAMDAEDYVMAALIEWELKGMGLTVESAA